MSSTSEHSAFATQESVPAAAALGDERDLVGDTMEVEDSALFLNAEGAAREVTRGKIDLWLLVVVALLVGIGMLVVYTGSSVEAARRLGDDMYFVRQQLIGAALGFVALSIGTRIDYRWYRDLQGWIYGLTLLLLVAVLVVGVEVNGAQRWLDLGLMRFQPAELAKVTICIFMAYSMNKRVENVTQIGQFFGQFIPVALLAAPLIVQPDFGSTVIVCAIAGVMLIMGGAQWKHTIVSLAAVTGLGGWALTWEQYRRDRIAVWLDPWQDYAASSFQLIQGWVAMGRGGLQGTGFAQGHAILGYIPEMYNDWAAALIGEEFGFVGFAFFLGLYVFLGWRGYRIAMRATDRFGALLAFALTTLIVGQAAFNLGVVVGVLPTKGLTLPFVSYGRSSLLLMLFAVGILLNISQQNPDLRYENSRLSALFNEWRARRRGEERWREERIQDIRSTTGRDE